MNIGKSKVIFFLFPAMGGSERITINIAGALDPEKYEVSFVIVGPNKGTVFPFIPKDNKTTFIRIKNLWDFTVSKIYHHLKVEKPDIVFSSVLSLNVCVIIASKLYGKAKIIVRNDNMLSYYPWYFVNLARISYPMSDLIIAQTEEMQADLERLFSFKKGAIVTMHNPIDTKKIDALVSDVVSPFTSSNIINIISVASIDRKKGQDTLIGAFAKFHNKNPHSKLYLIGEFDANSPFYIELLELIEQLKLRDVVCFVGLQSNPYVWMKYCSCFVLPSRIEGLPNVLLEAMYLRAPVVATLSVPIISRMVSSGINGYVVPVDDVEAMCQAMQKSIELKDFEMQFVPSNIHDFTRQFEKVLTK